MDAVLAGRAQGAAEVAETTPKTDENEKSPETALERAEAPEPPNHPQNENKRFCNSFATGLRADFENASESDDENEDEEEEIYFRIDFYQDEEKDLNSETGDCEAKDKLNCPYHLGKRKEELKESLEKRFKQKSESSKEQTKPTGKTPEVQTGQDDSFEWEETAEKLNLPSFSEIKADEVLPRYSQEQARNMLEKGFTVESPYNGMKIVLGDAVIKHWAEENKSEQDISGRLRLLPEAVETLKNPHEIWEIPGRKGSDDQLAFYRVSQKGKNKRVVNCFVLSKDGTLRTYFQTSAGTGADKKRHGKLRYRREK